MGKPNNKSSNGAAVSYGATDDDDRKDDNGVAETAVVEPEEHHSLLGIFLVMLGAFSFSCMFLFAKLLEGTANSFSLVFYRSLVQIVISVVQMRKEGERYPLGPPEARPWLLVRGGFGSLAVLAFFYAIQHLPLPDAVTLQFTTPPFAAAFAVCLAGEPWMFLDMVGAVVCLGGVVLIAHPSWLFGAPTEDVVSVYAPVEKALAIAIGLLGAALAGMAYMSVRLIGDRASANVMVLYYAVMSIPIVWVGSKIFVGSWAVWGDTSLFTWGDYGLLLLTGFGGYGGQYFTNKGLQRESAATGTLATCTQIVWTYIFELTLLHEPINMWSVSGTVLILGFMVIVGVSKMKKPKPTDDHETVADQSEEAALLVAAEHDSA